MSESATQNPYLDLAVWQELCEWLDQQHGKCAYQHRVPGHLYHLIYRGGNSAGKAAAEARFRVNLVFYQCGHGWRLRKGWKTNLERWRAEGVRTVEQAEAELAAVQTRKKAGDGIRSLPGRE